MKIKILSPTPDKLIPIIKGTGDEVEVHTFSNKPPDLVISYNWRKIIPQHLLDVCPHINLHISLLPYNRGADPNFWSWFDNTPKGVTIHYMDAGVDTGPVICQAEVHPLGSTKYTLRSFYETLHETMLHFFKVQWPRIATLPPGQPQSGDFPTHRRADALPFLSKLPLGWDTTVSCIEEMGAAYYARLCSSPKDQTSPVC